MQSMDPSLVNPTNALINVLPTLQVSSLLRDQSLTWEHYAVQHNIELENEVHDLDEALEHVHLERPDCMSDDDQEDCPEAARMTPPPTPSSSTPATPSQRWKTPKPAASPYPHIFAVGDAADAFGALKAGHCAYYQVLCRFFSH
jgi:apoptosis-inducing factor 2